jgi:hypothetical protein
VARFSTWRIGMLSVSLFSDLTSFML